MRRMLIITALAVVATTLPVKADNRYRVGDVKHIGASRPIPPAHARCMRYIDGYLGWVESGLDRGFKLPLTRAVQRRTYAEIAAMDWGPPSPAEAATMVANAENDLPAQENELTNSRASRRRGLDALARSHDLMTRDMWRQSVAIADANVTMFESKVRLVKAKIGFGRCVLQNSR
jgi:hypothetical protein